MDIQLKKRALEEYNNPELAIRRGGVNGNAFWNIQAQAFMYCPSFDFAPLAGCVRYLFEAKDETGKTYTFEADNSYALLTPVWDKLAVGQVTVCVYALDNDGNKLELIGARSFHKAAPFTGEYPDKAVDYRTCAKRAYDYLLTIPYVSDWAEGKYNTDYQLGMFVTKMNSAIIPAMLNYAKLSPENAEKAMAIAKNAADFMIKVSAPAGSPLEGLPPTYYFTDDVDNIHKHHSVVSQRLSTTMLIYPCSAGNAYLKLYEETKDKKYLDAAIKIAEYYKANVCENGSWHQMLDVKTGKSLVPQYAEPSPICGFLYWMYAVTKDEAYKTLAENGMNYLKNNTLKEFHWEGQFEDAVLSSHYSNMTHFTASFLIKDIVEHYADDEKKVESAKEMARYIEDQFVVWDKPLKYNRSSDTKEWFYPSAVEQYAWYVPIDSSTASVLATFTNMHKLTKDELYLEKAKALANSITRMQNKENGLIPTHWKTKDCIQTGGDLWINCIIATANRLFAFAEYLDSLK
ncbi:MAG: hypothetical protein IKZ38_00170 [Clostridia bacterium]|nr:hypothetical protein [Clostridia bacterium]